MGTAESRSRMVPVLRRVEYRDLDSKVAGVSRGGKIVDEVVVRIGV